MGKTVLKDLKIPHIVTGSFNMSETESAQIAGTPARYKDITFSGFTEIPQVVVTFFSDDTVNYGYVSVFCNMYNLSTTSCRILIREGVTDPKLWVRWAAIGF